MSRSPKSEQETEQVLEYLEASRKLTRLLELGRSFSGRERNKTFVATGAGEPFADVSAVAGFDFPQDGRAVVPIDWDRDGDLDVWIGSRTAPMLRFLRNDAGRTGRSVALWLLGTSSNRDAVGAKVELEVDGLPGRSVRGVRAGGGFMSQASRWLHFGLGDRGTPSAAVVRWPDGTVERFPGIDAGGRYLLVEGEGAPKPWGGPGTVTLDGIAAPPVDRREVVRLVTGSRVPLPLVPYTTFDGEVRQLAGGGGPVALMLWASWCAPCVEEMRAMVAARDALEAAGVRIVALSVDGIGEDAETTPDDAAKLVDAIAWPYEAGVASPDVLDKLELVLGLVFGRERALPVPTTLLIDPSGVLGAVYRGAIDAEELGRDARALVTDPGTFYAAAMPFQGSWAATPRPVSPTVLAGALLDRGHPADAVALLDYAARLLDAVGGVDPVYVDTRQALGLHLLEAGDTVAAESQFREALRRDEEHVPARAGLGRALAARGEFDAAITEFESIVARRPSDPVALNNLGTALAQRGAGDDRANAEAVFLRALAAEPKNEGARSNLVAMYLRNDRGPDAEALLRRLVEADPDHHDARAQLIAFFQREGRTRDALIELRYLLERDPARPIAALSLAWILATHPDDGLRNGREAMQIANGLVLATGSSEPVPLDTLAAALAELGRFEQAIVTAERAASLYDEAERPGDAAEVRSRIAAYREGRAWRE